VTTDTDAALFELELESIHLELTSREEPEPAIFLSPAEAGLLFIPSARTTCAALSPHADSVFTDRSLPRVSCAVCRFGAISRLFDSICGNVGRYAPD